MTSQFTESLDNGMGNILYDDNKNPVKVTNIHDPIINEQLERGAVSGDTIAINSITGKEFSDTLKTTIGVQGTNDVIVIDGIHATYRLYIGHATDPTSAAFSVTKAGVLAATGATITGSITATSGTIGGWTIAATTLTATNIVLDSGNQKITAGTGNDIIALDAADATYRLAIGHATYASAPFRVSKAGVVTATSGTIGGWTLGATTLTGTSIVLDAGNEKILVGGSSEIDIDGANKRIRSSNYTSGFAGTGFSLSSDFLEVGNIAARGMIRTAVFQKDVISAVGGNLLILASDKLEDDMTALDASGLVTEGNTAYAVGDILRMKDGTDDEWIEVDSVSYE